MTQVLKGGFPVFSREYGHGHDRAVLLHCALAHSKAWQGTATCLADRLYMVAPDMPGHGQSADWDNRCDIHDQVTAIARACLEDGAHVIGHSFGATVALRLAMEAPQLVRSVTLIEPVLFAAAGESDPTVLRAYLDKEADFGKALNAGDWDSSAEQFIQVWGDGRPWGTLTDKERQGFSSKMHFIRDTQDILVNDTANLLASGRLESISCPALLIRGAQTEPVIAAIHATLARRIPNASDMVVPDAGHMVPITHPKHVCDLILAMLDAA